MSNGRLIFLLVVLALGAAAAHVLLSVMPAAPTRRIVQPRTLVDATFEPDDVTIVRPDRPPIRTVRNEDGWRLVAPFGAVVDETVPLRLLDVLRQTPVGETVTDAELASLGRTRANLLLEPPHLSVTLTGGATVRTLDFGDWTPTSNGVYVAVRGETAVSIVPSAVRTAVDLPVGAFRRRSVFSAAPEVVLSFEVRRAAAQRQLFVRTAEGWRVGETRARAATVEEFLTALSSAEALDFVWPTGATNEQRRASVDLLSGFGLDGDSALTAVFACADGSEQRLSFGKAAGEGRVYALVQEGGAVVTLPSSLADFLRQDAETLSDARLFPLERSAVASFTLRKGESVCALARCATGWRLDAPIAAPADAPAVDRLLTRLLALSSADRASVGVSVSVNTNGSPECVREERVLGKGERLADLRAPELLAIAKDRVKRLVSVTGGKEASTASVVFSRVQGSWSAEKPAEVRTIRERNVAKVLKALEALRARSIVALTVTAAERARYGLETPAFTLAVDLEDEGSLRRNILIGAKTEGGRYATIGAADAVVVLSEDDVEALTAPLVE